MHDMAARRQVLRERQRLGQMPKERRRDECNVRHLMRFAGCHGFYLPHGAAAATQSTVSSSAPSACAFAAECADQNQRDYRAFMKAVRESQIRVVTET